MLKIALYKIYKNIFYRGGGVAALLTPRWLRATALGHRLESRSSHGKYVSLKKDLIYDIIRFITFTIDPRINKLDATHHLHLFDFNLK